ncbi:hypothetical protein VCV18_000172 [Metarhizium anisopliae]
MAQSKIRQEMGRGARHSSVKECGREDVDMSEESKGVLLSSTVEMAGSTSIEDGVPARLGAERA